MPTIGAGRGVALVNKGLTALARMINPILPQSLDVQALFEASGLLTQWEVSYGAIHFFF